MHLCNNTTGPNSWFDVILPKSTHYIQHQLFATHKAILVKIAPVQAYYKTIIKHFVSRHISATQCTGNSNFC